VAGLIIMPLRGQSAGRAGASMLMMGLAVNAAWGLGTAIFYRLFSGGRR
jgi:mannitol-specific phosphotransferase system IIBC component